VTAIHRDPITERYTRFVRLVESAVGRRKLVGILVIGIIQGVEALGSGIVNPAEAGATPDTVLVSVNHEPAKTDRPAFIGIPAFRQAAGFGHSADREGMDGNGRTLLAEDMRAWDENRATNWIRSLGGLQRAQNSVANVLYLNVTFDNFRIAAADIGDDISQFDVLPPASRGEALDLANSELRSMSRNELLSREVDTVARQSRLSVGDANQEIGEKTNCYGCDGSNSTIVLLQKLYDTPQEIDNNTKHRSPLIPFGFLAVLIAIPFLGWIAATDK
jgi:hypothetical protein